MIHVVNINEVMLAVSHSLAASIVAKATVITALGLIGAWLTRARCAAVRHSLLAATFAVLLALPIASIVAPPIRIAVPADAQERTGPGLAGSANATSTIAPSHPHVRASSENAASAELSWSALLLTAWVIGMALFLLPVIIGLWQVRSLRRSALPWQHGQSVGEALALDAGIDRRVEVLLHESLSGPMTCGVLHPAIVLPRDAQDWEKEDLNRAIVHELEHVRRGDWVSHCLARAVCAVYWFHPLVWIAWRQLELAAERSCDDAVLGCSEATAYADQLVGLAQRLSRVRKSPALAMASRADLSARVNAVLDSRQRRGRVGPFPVALTCAAAAMLVIGLSPLSVVAAPQVTYTDATSAPFLKRFTANTSLVITDVSVKDPSGKAVEGLRASDFVVTEDGKTQSISIFDFQKLDGTPRGAPGSYYILGYYTANSKADGAYRRVGVALRDDTTDKLDYRAGYYGPNSGMTFEVDGFTDADAGANVAFPSLLSKTDPEYSEQARKAKYSGSVILTVGIDTSGKVADIKVVKSLGMGLDEKAIEAVTQWKFRPGTKDGNPVAMHAQVEVNFRLL